MHVSATYSWKNQGGWRGEHRCQNQYLRAGKERTANLTGPGESPPNVPLLHPSSWSDRGCYYDTDICAFSLSDRSCNVLTSTAMAGWSIKRHPVSSTPRLMS